MTRPREYDDAPLPGSAVVLVEARWGGSWASGSGFLAGRNDVITATHVVFNARWGGLAEEIRVVPSFDPDEPLHDVYHPVDAVAFPAADPDGDGWIQLGDRRPGTLVGSELDVALLSLSLPAGDRYGWLGIDWGFTGGQVTVLGHPAAYGRQPMADAGSSLSDPVDGILWFGSDLQVSAGNSGGPVLTGASLAAGVVSTGSTAAALAAHRPWLVAEMAANDRQIGLTLWGSGNADRLLGTDRSDVIEGRGGDDEILGLGGIDTAVYAGSPGQYMVTQFGGTPAFQVRGPDGTDVLRGVERLRFNDAEVSAVEAAAASTRGAIHRLYNRETGTHLFTASAQEAGQLGAGVPSFDYEGLAFRGTASGVSALDVFRFLNRETGAHLLTASADERDEVMRSLPQYQYEGVAFRAYQRDEGPQEEVYRFFNLASGTHFFTTSEHERDLVVRSLPQFRYEGIAFWVDPV